MIVDRIEHLNSYVSLSCVSSEIINFIEQSSKSELAVGKYEILSDNLFALIQKYTTKEEEVGFPESHVKYIDLQYIVSGSEIVLWNSTSELNETKNEIDDNDIIFYEKKPYEAKTILSKGMFAVFFTQDAHTPCVKINNKDEVKKIVFKIKKEALQL